RAEKGDPMRLNCYNNYIPLPSLKELIEMGEKVSWELALEALKAELIEPLERIPRTGVVNANRFLTMFESLTSTVLKEEVKREVRARILPVVKRLYKARSRRWIERVLNTGLSDGRKRFIVWCAAPYLASKVREGLMTEQEAVQKLLEFTTKAGEGKIRESQLRAWLRWALKNNRKPLSQASFLKRYPDLREVLGGAYER
ncbi:MAG: DNA primase noncatalytic subunit PriX, partial [Thermosphaera sp.]